MWNANRPGPEWLFTSPEWNSEETLIEAGAAGHQRGEVVSTDRWRRLRAPGKGIHVMCPLPLCGRASGVSSDSRGARFWGHITLERPEPIQQFGIGLPRWLPRNLLFCSARHYALFQSSLLGANGNFGVAIGGLQGCMAEPCTDHIHLDTGFQKMHRSGVDINTIRAWLGHVSLDTTHVYAEVDMEMKATALASVDIKGLAGTEPRRTHLPSLMAFLKGL